MFWDIKGTPIVSGRITDRRVNVVIR